MNVLVASPSSTAPRRTLPPAPVADIGTCLFILLAGLFELTHYPHAADFLGDVSYPDLARSLLSTGTYAIRHIPETTWPPGFPFLLACVGRILGLSPAVDFGVVAVSAVLGLLTACCFLRRVEGRGIAIIACLLLAASPSMFGFNTELVYPEMSYMFASMAALVLALAIDRARPGPRLALPVVLLAAALASAFLIRSVGVALLAGLFSWIAVSFLMRWQTGARRLARFAFPLAAGVAAYFAWSIWAHHHQVLEWDLPGYPRSYLEQLTLKNGHHPEGGFAHLADIPGRIGHNLVAYAAGFSQLLLRRHIALFWSSPAVAGVILAVALGLGWSLRAGGDFCDWYFLWYACVFVFWPWNYNDRFVFPIWPLACLYLWRGAKAIKCQFRRHPRKTAAGFVLAASGLCAASAAFALRVARFPSASDHTRGDHLQAVAAALFWGLLAAAGIAWLLLPGLRVLLAQRSTRRALRIVLPAGAALAVIWSVFGGIRTIVAIGRAHMHPDITQQFYYPEIDAATWIRLHSSGHHVVFSDEPEVVFHYGLQPTVWFPPISRASVLIDGMRRYHVDLVVVTHHQDSYWQPSEEACFHVLQDASPAAFRLIYSNTNDWVYSVDRSRLGSPTPSGSVAFTHARESPAP